MQKLLTFFSAKNISVYVIFNDQSFNDTLTNDIVSFKQLGPGSFPTDHSKAVLLLQFFFVHWWFHMRHLFCP